MAREFGRVVGIDAQGAPAALAEKQDVASQITAQWQASHADAATPGDLRMLFPSDGIPTAAVALGKQHEAPKTAPDALPSEEVFLRNERLEWTRKGAGKGLRALDDLRSNVEQRTIAVDSLASPHAAAEGALLGAWTVNHFKTRGPSAAYRKDSSEKGGLHATPVPLAGAESEGQKKALRDDGDALQHTATPLSWWTGEVYAEAQNWSRELQETAANLMTPTIFAERVTERFKNVPHTRVEVHDADWVKSQNMNLFLSVAQGSEQPLRFVVVHYEGAPDAKDAPLAFVGKG